MKNQTKRRGSKEGAVYQRGDGKWCASISNGFGNSGKRLRKVVYGKSKTEVLEKLRKLTNDAANGLLFSNDNYTISEYLSIWLETSCKSRNRKSTYHRYKSIVTNHVTPFIGKQKLTNKRGD